MGRQEERSRREVTHLAAADGQRRRRSRCERSGRSRPWTGPGGVIDDMNTDTTQTTDEWLETRRVRIAPIDEAGIVGVGHALDALRSVAARLRHARAGEPPIPRGLLLAGPPGTGKSLCAAWFAGSLGEVAAYDLPPDTLTPERVRETFAVLASRRRSVLFLPEIDAIGMSRDWGGHDRESRKVLFALLEAMDGMVQVPADRGAIVVATTNRSRSLDGSLTRHGRLGLTVTFREPDASERHELLRVFLTGRPTGVLDLAYIGELMSGWTPAAIRGAVDSAHGAAMARDGRGAPIRESDLLLAIRRQGGIEHEPDVTQTATSTHRTAIHEAGHVAAAVRLGLVVRSVRLGISGRDGRTTTCDEGAVLDDAGLRATVVVAMAGIAAERLLLGEGTLGGTRDVANATRILIDRIGAGIDPAFPPIDRRSFGEYVPRVLDEAIAEHTSQLLARAREDAMVIVTQERDGIERLAARLVIQPVLAGDALVDAIADAGLASPLTTVN